MSIDEQEIQFRKRARRRLVGAIALVLLMVTVLPMVLDDRTSSLPQHEIEISIPSQNGDEFTSNITPYEPEALLDDPEAPAEPPVKEDETPRQETASAPAPVQAVKPAADAKPAATAKPRQQMASPTYTVQIGVFSDAANVRQLEGKLKALGLHTSTETIQTVQGEKIRLRVGPFSSRDQAEEAMTKVRTAGLSGMILTNK
ncbi:MAG TPA: SPOR domain-containing protein [Methylophilaceae bacterium]|jgi:DedD protein